MSDKFSNEGDIKTEVNDLIKNYTKRNRSDYSIREDLKKKYGDGKINDIMSKYKKEMDDAKKLAEKIKYKLIKKYPNLTMDQYIKKIGEYGKKYEFGSAVKSVILYLLFNKDGRDSDQEYEAPYTQMSKALGYVPKSYHFSRSLDSKGEEEEVQAILKLGAATEELHNQVQLQSLIYEPCSPSVLMNDFQREKVNMFQNVHPIFFAFFFPKIEILERHMIFASIPNIIKKKYAGEDLQTQPDVELYNDICTDPVETTCSQNNNKPFVDLLSRSNVEVMVWENIIALRQGKFYSSDHQKFMKLINDCKSNMFDMADYAYIKDEATIVRKLFAVYSLRPTYISTSPSTPSMGISSSTHMAQIYSPNINTIPMIPLRMNQNNVDVDNPEPLSLFNALNDRQVFYQGRNVVVKDQQIIYSKDIVVFYVNRRYQTNTFTRMLRPYETPTLPMTMNTYERLNDVDVQFSFNLPLGSQSFKLISAIAVETVNIQEGVVSNNQIILGCSAIVIPEDIDIGYMYTPLDYGANSQNESNNLTPITRIPKTTRVKYKSQIDNNTELYSSTIVEKLEKQGTIFVYKCDSGMTQNTASNVFGF